MTHWTGPVCSAPFPRCLVHAGSTCLHCVQLSTWQLLRPRLTDLSTVICFEITIVWGGLKTSPAYGFWLVGLLWVRRETQFFLRLSSCCIYSHLAEIPKPCVLRAFTTCISVIHFFLSSNSNKWIKHFQSAQGFYFELIIEESVGKDLTHLYVPYKTVWQSIRINFCCKSPLNFTPDWHLYCCPWTVRTRMFCWKNKKKRG